MTNRLGAHGPSVLPADQVVVPGRTTTAEYVRRRLGTPEVASVPIHEQ